MQTSTSIANENFMSLVKHDDDNSMGDFLLDHTRDKRGETVVYKNNKSLVSSVDHGQFMSQVGHHHYHRDKIEEIDEEARKM